MAWSGEDRYYPAMNHVVASEWWALTASFLASMAGAAVAIFAGIRSARRAKTKRPAIYDVRNSNRYVTGAAQRLDGELGTATSGRNRGKA